MNNRRKNWIRLWRRDKRTQALPESFLYIVSNFEIVSEMPKLFARTWCFIEVVKQRKNMQDLKQFIWALFRLLL